MFRLRKPDRSSLAQIRAHYADLPLTYAAVGCSRGTVPAGFVSDHHRVQLGSGAAVFARARQALRDWRMLQLGWVEPCWPDAAIKEGVIVGTLARAFGLWAVNVCRIVFVVDDDGPVARYGFAYGTLPGHAAIGEERLQVEWDRADDRVFYEIQAVSRPGQWLTRLAYPLLRRVQHRFGRDSLRAMVAAVSTLPSGG
jgi:uncharacterized protein (UPF0548 family)